MLSILKNTIVQFNIVLWIAAFYLYKKTGRKRYLLLVYAIFVLNEVLHYFTGLDLYHPHQRTQLFYESGEVGQLFSSDFTDMSNNFTEAHYKDKKCTSPSIEETERFVHFVQLLDIQKGDVVLDLGCGYGDLVGFMRKRGIDAYGMTISNEQYDNCVKTYGNYFYLGDYTKYKPELVLKFDFIIMPGSLEHTYGGHSGKMSTYIYKYKAMSKFFDMIKRYFRRESTQKKVFTTTIHANRRFINTKEYYILERMYGGSYPLISKYSVADSLRASGYEVKLKKDYTWHYYYASFCNNNHFGNPVDLNKAYMIPLALFYPATIYFYIYFTYGYWMWMWDGKHHYQRDHDECVPQKGCDLSFEKDTNRRPATLLYTIGQLR
tara:strand:- start:408 stop:1538 length:1131 start_codon:yes stop_codon:yes gene_type:complete